MVHLAVSVAFDSSLFIHHVDVRPTAVAIVDMCLDGALPAILEKCK